MSIAHRFILLVEKFVTRVMTAREFAEQSLEFYQQHYDELYADDPTNNIIADLCLEADALTNEPPFKVAPDELRESARKALEQLTALQTERNKSA